VEDHFDVATELERHLEKTGKIRELESLRQIDALANFIYIRQKNRGYGNGLPALAAAPIVQNEPFLYIFGDNVVQKKDSFAKQMVKAFEKINQPIIGVTEVPKEAVHRYGIVAVNKNKTGLEVTNIVEKPSVSEAPSRLAVTGYYLLTPAILKILTKTKAGKGGEIWLTDALKTYLKKGGQLFALPVKSGHWYDIGDPVEYLKTSLLFAWQRPELKNQLKDFIKKKLR
jgi:UTP--glucose-1-phosphate uridylyltransferase